MTRILTYFQGAAVSCLILQRRLAKLDESGAQAKGPNFTLLLIVAV